MISSKLWCSKGVFITCILVFPYSAFSQVKKPYFGASFPIETAPTKGDWQRFHVLTESELKEFWDINTQRKANLNNWAWQWRLGWLQVCGQKLKSDWCEPIFEAGLNDDAVAVRAEAATQFSSAKKGKKISPKDIALLEQSYHRKDNFRRGKPLFVCQKILLALHNLNSPQANATANKLVRKDKKMAAYWNSLKKEHML